MDARQRALYLEALGIDVWRLREQSGADANGSASGGRHAESQARAQADGRAESGRGIESGRSVEPSGRAPEPAEWAALRAEVVACTKCPLHRTRTQAVFGVGDIRAQWLVVGEAPGAEEDRRGEPFVGRAGQLLDSMLRAIGLARGEGVYIANILKSRPPGNRDPRPDEVASCLGYLERQIGLIRPALILAVGRIAAQNLLGTPVALARLRGRVHRFGALNTPVVVTYHPAYLLRTPADKRKAWEDLKFARSVFRELTASP